jgi:hypothetical protein
MTAEKSRLSAFPDPATRYAAVRAARRVPRAPWRNAHTWGRCSRPFCQQYRHRPADSTSLQVCLGTRASTGHTAAQRAQAPCAVASYAVCWSPQVRPWRSDDPGAPTAPEAGAAGLAARQQASVLGPSRLLAAHAPVLVQANGASAPTHAAWPEVDAPVTDDSMRPFAPLRARHQADRQQGDDGVLLPASFDTTATAAARALVWPWCVPAHRLTRVAATRDVRRDHGPAPEIQRASTAAARTAGLPPRVSPHTLRHSCATPLGQAHDNLRQRQQRRGHRAVRTTMRDTQTITADLKP